MQIVTRAEIRIARPVAEVFDFATACATFPRVLLPLGPIPGIARAELLHAAEPKAGARRRITMSDGSVIDEEILAFERPSKHRYRWLDRPAAPFSFLVRAGEGEWTFTPAEGGTRLEWAYRFDLTTPLVAPLTALVLLLFRRWMQRGLERIRDALLRDAV